jgi:single-strand DNA-binding protein
MMTKLVRIGRDAELKTTNSGKSVIGLACVYDIGWGENKRGQWIDVSIWGKQAESLAPFLLKGKQIVISADDVELEIYKKNDGSEGSKLKCRAINIDLVGSKQDGQQQAPQQYQTSNQPNPQNNSAFPDNNQSFENVTF